MATEREIMFAKAALGVAEETDVAIIHTQNFIRIYNMLSTDVKGLTKDQVMSLATQFANVSYYPNSSGGERHCDNCGDDYVIECPYCGYEP